MARTQTKDALMFVSYDGAYKLDEKEVEIGGLRYDSPYCKAARKAKEIVIDDNQGNKHILSFNDAIRKKQQ